MAITLKNPSEIEKMRIVGAATARVLEMISPHIVPGVTTDELDQIMNDYIEKVENAKSADLGYRGYPKATCISVNEVVCHGIPNNHKLHQGDIVNIDVTVLKDGYHGDSSRMYIVGNHTSPRNHALCKCAQESMYAAIRTIHPGSNLTEIGAAIQKIADKAGFSIVRDYCGHGIGAGFHEEPQVLHYKNNYNLVLEAGMCFTIEPMINAGTFKVKVNKKDGWTVTTQDKQPSAQYEHTLLVLPDGVEVLTLRSDEDFPRIITH
jgi:methionyl aminopeptidase